APGCVTWELILDGYSESSYSATPRFAAARLPWFMMNNNSLFAIRLLKDTEGNYLWRPGLELGQPSSLAGYGIAENEQMPDIAADAKAIAFGNFKRGYTIVDRIGTRILRDPYTNKPFVGFYTTKRTGGMLVDSQAIKLLKIAAA
ncbi:phage major capsid protein, partial [Escherichia coli]